MLAYDAVAFNNRGTARQAKGDLDGALQDYAEAKSGHRNSREEGWPAVVHRAARGSHIAGR
jgi:hypothetical protein